MSRLLNALHYCIVIRMSGVLTLICLRGGLFDCIGSVRQVRSGQASGLKWSQVVTWPNLVSGRQYETSGLSGYKCRYIFGYFMEILIVIRVVTCDSLYKTFQVTSC